MTTTAEATTEPGISAEAKAAVMLQTVARLQDNPESNEKVVMQSFHFLF